MSTICIPCVRGVVPDWDTAWHVNNLYSLRTRGCSGYRGIEYTDHELSPCTRGCSQIIQPRKTNSKLFPAYVGFFRILAVGSLGFLVSPHTRGCSPNIADIPHTRGVNSVEWFC